MTLSRPWFLAFAILVAVPIAAHSQSELAPARAPAPDPRPDPEDRADVLIEEEKAAETVAPPPPSSRVPDDLAETDEAFAACIAVLDRLGAKYQVSSEPITNADPECGVERPITVAEIVPGVALNPDSRMRCETAVALSSWVADFVVPAARLLPDRREIVGVEHGSTYVCRRRNNLPTGPLSEHAFGNAIDVMGFRFAEGPPIRIEPRERTGSIEESFQRAVRYSACMLFSTVIGPGTDAAHADHLHLDVKARRGDWRLCQ